jgi:Domain of unknown function (DUF4340)
MSTRTLLNLVLLLAALGLALVAWFKPGVKSVDAPRPITTGVAPAQIGNITVERFTRDPLKFSKRDGRWFLLANNRELPAADFQVRALLRLLEATATRRYPAGSLDLASLGLQPHQARVVMDDVEFRFGTTDALENQRYVQVGDTVYLIDDQYQHLLNADWPNFVSRQILEGRGAITRLELPDMTLAYADDGHWRLDPDQEGVGADTLLTFIENWQNATALLTRRHADSATGETVTVHTRDSDEPIVLRIVTRTPDLILDRPAWGIQYQLPGSEADSLLTLPQPAPESAAQPTGDAARSETPSSAEQTEHSDAP